MGWAAGNVEQSGVARFVSESCGSSARGCSTLRVDSCEVHVSFCFAIVISQNEIVQFVSALISTLKFIS